jgi:hypothetical protein
VPSNAHSSAVSCSLGNSYKCPQGQTGSNFFAGGSYAASEIEVFRLM